MSADELHLVSHFQASDQYGHRWVISERAHFAVRSTADGCPKQLLIGRTFSMMDSTSVLQIDADTFSNWDDSLRFRRLVPTDTSAAGCLALSDEARRDAGNDCPHQPDSPDPLGAFRSAAEAAGLIRPGETIDQNQVDFAYEIVERCARVAESYADLDDSTADVIRAVLGDR